MKGKILIFLIGFGLLISCNNDDSSEFIPTEINFINIEDNGFLTGNEGIPKSSLTISNTEEWQDLISKMNIINDVSRKFSEIDIDFDEFTVFAIILEVKSGTSIEIQNVIENKNNISIVYEESLSLITAITQPFQIIKIPKTNKTLIVTEL